MPNWKKVITSGSAGELSSLIAPSITGSLLGTASYAITSSLPLLGFISASTAGAQLTLIKGDGTSQNLTLNTGSVNFATSASYSETASYVLPLHQNVQVTGSIYVSGGLYYNTNTSPTMQPGALAWNNGEGTLQLGLVGGNVDLTVGEQLYQYVYNSEAVTLNKGTVVLVSGSQGGRIAVKIASPNTEELSFGTLGFVAETIAAGAEGWVMTEGSLRGVDTSLYTGGQLLFLGSNGTYTTTPPTAPSHSVRLGYVQKVNASTGIIYVKIDNGYELNELHDVLINGVTTGDLLMRSGSVWKNTKQLTGSYGITGSLSVTGSTNVVGSLLIKENGTDEVINSVTRTLKGTGGTPSVDWDNKDLYDTSQQVSIDWENKTLEDGGVTSLNWASREAYDNLSAASINWNDRTLFDDSGTTPSVNWNGRTLYDSTGDSVLDWQTRQFNGTSSLATTASFALTASHITPLVQNVLITGSTNLNGALTTKTTRITGSSYTASINDYRIGIRYTNTGPVSIQLPLISQVGQIEYRFKDEEGNADLNNIILLTSGSNLIDGSTIAILDRNYIAISLYNDGVSNWYIE